jgi:hypothetical protein
MADPATTVPGERRGSGGERLANGSDDELGRLLHAISGADSVELKISVPDSDRNPVLTSLDLDPLDAVIRQIAFVDTPDLRLNRAGVIIRIRRTQQRPADLTVKLRPVEPDSLPDRLRTHRSVTVEVDASPAGFVCSCAVKHEVPDDRAVEVIKGRPAVGELFSRPQRELLSRTLPDGVPAAELKVLGPVHVLRAKFVPKGYPRRLVAELWFLPDGDRMFELSTRCSTDEAFMIAAETRVFLAGHGVDIDAPQDTKTSTALRTLAAGLTDAGQHHDHD